MVRLGSELRNALPYPFVMRRRSVRMSTPESSALRMSRPAACFVSSTAAGSTYRRQAWSSRVARSQDSGSVGLEKGSLGMTTPFERGAWRVEPFPEALEREQGQMLVGQEVVAQAFDRHAPFLADQAQIVALQRRLHRFEAVLHLAPVREQREHGTALRAVHVDEQLLRARAGSRRRSVRECRSPRTRSCGRRSRSWNPAGTNGTATVRRC